MGKSREQICKTTSAKLTAAAANINSTKALIGLDGFVDEIIAVVDKRLDNDRYETIKTIDVLGNKILKAAGQSSNYELVVKQMKLGGNGPIMANALACAGFGVTYVGNLGYPNIHQVFKEFAGRAEEVLSIGEPGHTDALEFEDGKLMLGKLQTMGDVNWDNIVSRAGLDVFTKAVDRAKLIGMTNWTMLPYMNGIWTALVEKVLPTVSKQSRYFFVDLADPEKRTHADILAALKLLGSFQGKMEVMLGLNLKESSEIAEVLGLAVPADAEGAIEETAKAIRKAMNINTVVIHPRRGAAAATATESASFAGPFVAQPKISTGAGDHFNAGFCLGRVLGLELEECLCTGVGTSGYYVRTALSPSAMDLAKFCGELPPPQA